MGSANSLNKMCDTVRNCDYKMVGFLVNYFFFFYSFFFYCVFYYCLHNCQQCDHQPKNVSTFLVFSKQCSKLEPCQILRIQCSVPHIFVIVYFDVCQGTWGSLICLSTLNGTKVNKIHGTTNGTQWNSLMVLQ